MEHLTPPHGGKLCNLVVEEDRAEALKSESADFLSITLNQRQLCDLELLLNGGFSPLDGFMCRQTYESVIDDLCLPDGTPVPQLCTDAPVMELGEFALPELGLATLTTAFGGLLTKRDRELGMGRAITRRDLLNGAGIAITGSIAFPWACRPATCRS